MDRIHTTTATLQCASHLAALILAGCAAEVAEPADVVAPLDVPATLADAPDCTAPASGDAMPLSLSETGCFDAANPGQLVARVVPFEVNAPLWTDGAEKARWMSIPEGAAIRVRPDGHFELPPGTVLGKTFSMDGRRIETRLLVQHADGTWTGGAYEWSADQKDAHLVPDGDFLPEVGGDGMEWEIPSSGQCQTCHTAQTGFALGLQIAQLDRDVVDPSTGAMHDQLAALADAGLFAQETPPVRTPATPALVDYRDASQALADRARSYLHANCASCHTSAEAYCTGDFRAGAAAQAMGVCDVEPKDMRPDWDPFTRLLAPGDPARSAISIRMHATHDSGLQMPPVGRRRVDAEGAALIDEWIASMTGCES